MALPIIQADAMHYPVQQLNVLTHFCFRYMFVILCFQRTERAPKDRNVAETDPSKFANMLIEKLERVKEERDKIERVRETLSSVEVVKIPSLFIFCNFFLYTSLFFSFYVWIFLLWPYQLFFFLSPWCSLCLIALYF